MTIEQLEESFKLYVPPGGLLLVQVPDEKVISMDAAIKSISPMLRSRNIAVVLFPDDASLVMVPEARRVMALRYK